ncbi:MAG: hypothetical protein IJL49_05325 [Firmicutes bacterium]|nr:hypothetical protein [Bacillota bacterium]
MHILVEFIYILTMFISVAGFAVHMTVRTKGLEATSRLAKQKSTTAFLTTVLLLNLCDFMRLYLTQILAEPDLEWIYVTENILEVVLIYVLIHMEKEYLGLPMPRLSEAFFAVTALLLLYFDALLNWNGAEEERIYFILMIVINAAPIILLTLETIAFCRKSRSSDNRTTNGYIAVFIGLCIFVCIICTMSNADQQTKHQFFMHSEEVYEVIWLIFNVATFEFVWRTINKDDSREMKRQVPFKKRLDELKSSCGLSEREVEIAKLLYEGKSNKEIAAMMYLSPNTVKVHASNLYRKIGAENRVQAIQVMAGEKEAVVPDVSR